MRSVSLAFVLINAFCKQDASAFAPKLSTSRVELATKCHRDQCPFLSPSNQRQMHRGGGSSFILFMSESEQEAIDDIKKPIREGVSSSPGKKKRMRQRIKEIVSKPIKRVFPGTPSPGAIAGVIGDATAGALEIGVEEALALREKALAKVATDEAIRKAERAVELADSALRSAKDALAMATAASQASAEAEIGAASVAGVEEETTEIEIGPEFNETDFIDLSLSEMAPPFLDESSCLVPGEAVVRVERAPENSRRIFAGIDVMASVDDVWTVLTDYANLQRVVPNLVVNDVLEEYVAGAPVSSNYIDMERVSIPEQMQCELLSKQMKGALLKQVGGAKMMGINFSAKTTLEVREWPDGMPDFAHFEDEMYDGMSRDARATRYEEVKLQRYKFPRPFAISKLPHKDISMQSIENDDGEFRMYQGVWRMQELPGCSPPGKNAMRLTYAVEVSPRAYLPVRVIEGRIVQDLCTNLKAIREFVSEEE